MYEFGIVVSGFCLFYHHSKLIKSLIAYWGFPV